MEYFVDEVLIHKKTHEKARIIKKAHIAGKLYVYSLYSEYHTVPDWAVGAVQASYITENFIKENKTTKVLYNK